MNRPYGVVYVTRGLCAGMRAIRESPLRGGVHYPRVVCGNAGGRGRPPLRSLYLARRLVVERRDVGDARPYDGLCVVRGSVVECGRSGGDMVGAIIFN